MEREGRGGVEGGGEPPRRVLDYVKEREEKDLFLEKYFGNCSELEKPDPHQRYVACFQYKGMEEEKLTERYMMEEILVGCIDVIRSDVLAVIMPPGL